MATVSLSAQLRSTSAAKPPPCLLLGYPSSTPLWRQHISSASDIYDAYCVTTVSSVWRVVLLTSTTWRSTWCTSGSALRVFCVSEHFLSTSVSGSVTSFYLSRNRTLFRTKGVTSSTPCCTSSPVLFSRSSASPSILSTSTSLSLETLVEASSVSFVFSLCSAWFNAATCAFSSSLPLDYWRTVWLDSLPVCRIYEGALIARFFHSGGQQLLHRYSCSVKEPNFNLRFKLLQTVLSHLLSPFRPTSPPSLHTSIFRRR